MMANTTTKFTISPFSTLIYPPSPKPSTHPKTAFFFKSPTTTTTTTTTVALTTTKRNQTHITTKAAAATATPLSPTIHGVCYVVGDNIDTDQIIPAIYGTLNPSDPEEYKQLGAFALFGLPHAYQPRFVEPNELTSKYSIIIAGDNFGCGSSREHAPKCLGAAGAVAVVAESYARIFFRNCVSTGELYPLESEVRICDEFETGDEAVIHVDQNLLINCKTGKEFKLKAIGDAAPVIQAGGLFAYARKTSLISTVD